MTNSISTTFEGRRPTLAILVAVSAVNPLALNISLPSLPLLVDIFGTTAGMVQMSLSLYLAAVAVAQIGIGPLSDRYGRRPVLLWGLAIFVVGSVICAVAPSIEVLLTGRMLQATGGCAGIVLGRAIVRDLYDRSQAASMIGYVTMGLAVAPMIGPAIGGVVDQSFGWRSSSYLMVVLGLLVLVAAWFDLHETNHNRVSGGGVAGLVRSYGALSRSGLFWAYALTSAFTSAVFFGFLGGAPFVAADLLGMSPAVYGLYFILVAGGYVFGNWISGRYSGSIGMVRMIGAGNVVLVLAVSIIAFLFALGLVHPLSLFGPMFVVGVGNGMCLPNAIAGAVSVRPDLAGAASGLTGSLQIGAGAIASALAGWFLSGILWPGTIWPLVLVMATACVLSVIASIASRLLEAEQY
ncbi:multidrug effflux MFS transporter [Stappia taiwanensis]|uniref:Bcr/CflA family efflux transporter n=1 Tax=Stappia taiwanensis TaxID=992267 RepID=A0A838XJ59_9HYPH|nr:multidrug effflux MFS transporter [Stappia taiwanensis]MBA4610162.1 multidrug effflux MFS transporter [Stappia taiwanensis]